MDFVGYDMILELSRFTLEEGVKNFIGPVMENIELNFKDGPAKISMFFPNVEVIAKKGTAKVNINIHFNKTSIELTNQSIPNPWSLSMLEGHIQIEDVILHASDPKKPFCENEDDDKDQHRSYIEAYLLSSNRKVIFESKSEQTILNTFENKIDAESFKFEFEKQVAGPLMGIIRSNDLSFIICRGKKSTSPSVLSAEPDILWIDDDTLGIFCYYTNTAGGHVTKKLHSDRMKTNRRSAALLFSAKAFDSTVASKAVHDLVESILTDKKREELLEQERNKHNNPGPATDEEIAQVEKDLKKFFQSDEGKHLFSRNVPAPYGTGRLELPAKDITATLHELAITLGKDQINFRAKMSMNLDLGLGGSAGADIEIPLSTSLIVENERINPTPFKMGEPVVRINSHGVGGFLIDTFISYLKMPIMGTLATMAITSLINSIEEDILNSIFEEKVKNQGIPVPKDINIEKIMLEEDGLLIHVIVARKPAKAENPVVKIIVGDPIQEPSKTMIATNKLYDFPGTKYGCPPQTFQFTVNHFDTMYNLTVQTERVPVPVKVRWEATIGFAFGWDTRPDFSGGPIAELSAPLTQLSGYVSFQDPPPQGRVERLPSIPLQVTTDNKKKTALVIKGSAGDGNFFLRLEVEVVDANEQVYREQIILPFNGEVLSFDSDYEKAMDDCNQKYLEWLSLNKLKNSAHTVGQVSHIPMWAPIWDPIELAVVGIREAIVKKEPGTFLKIQQLITQHGEHISNLILNAPPTISLERIASTSFVIPRTHNE